MTKICIFLGPSLPKSELNNYLKINAKVFPPIKRGDLDKLAKDFQVIVIIDGIFHNQLAVSPREILLQLKQEKEVYGSSSMGAIRAVELKNYGMVGFGKIYNMYLNGEIFSDGDISLLFEPISYKNITIPPVNIRYGINSAKNLGLLSEEEASFLIEESKKIHYSELDYNSLVIKAYDYFDNKKIEDFLKFVRKNSCYLDLKKRDAIGLIRLINCKYKYKDEKI